MINSLNLITQSMIHTPQIIVFSLLVIGLVGGLSCHLMILGYKSEQFNLIITIYSPVITI